MTFGAGRGATAVLRSIAAIGALGVIAVLRLCVGTGWWYVLPAVLYTAAWWYSARWTRSVCGTADDERITVRHGVLWVRETVVPLQALRTLETVVPPLHRAFGCRTVVLRFAGGSVWLPLLDEQTATELMHRWEAG